jgi:Tfp pilus assembly protein PilE
MPVRIHLGLGLTAAVFGVGATLAEPSWQRVVQAIRADADAAELSRLARRFAAFYGIEQALKLVILVLMVFKL